MKIAFAGTPDFAATVLRGLISSDHEVGLIVSQPDARKGRGRRAQPTPVAQLARSLDLPLRQPARISEVAGEISSHDALVVAAYGQILRPDTLYAASEGAWNVHASLLPKYRGAADLFAPADPARMGDRGRLLTGLETHRSESARVRLEREWGELHRRACDLVTGPGGRQILLADPDGNLIELFQPAHRPSVPTPTAP